MIKLKISNVCIGNVINSVNDLRFISFHDNNCDTSKPPRAPDLHRKKGSLPNFLSFGELKFDLPPLIYRKNLERSKRFWGGGWFNPSNFPGNFYPAYLIY